MQLTAAHAVMDDADQLLVRTLGKFVLKGKQKALVVLEIVGHRASASPREVALCSRFDEAMNLLQHRQKEACERCLIDIILAVGSDGPACFYVELLNGRGASDVILDDRGIVWVNGK